MSKFSWSNALDPGNFLLYYIIQSILINHCFEFIGGHVKKLICVKKKVGSCKKTIALQETKVVDFEKIQIIIK